MSKTGFSGETPSFFAVNRREESTLPTKNKKNNAQENPEKTQETQKISKQINSHTDQAAYGEIHWFSEKTRSQKLATTVITDQDEIFRIIHSETSENNTRGYIYRHGHKPGCATLSFSLEKSPSERKNKIEIVRVGPYCAEIINGIMTSFRHPHSLPKPQHAPISSAADFITFILSEAAGNSKLWRRPAAKRTC